MKKNGLQIALDDHELEYLKKIHNAQALRELTHHPGWEIYTKIIEDMVARLENQHLEFAESAPRDVYWASGLKLAGVRKFAKILEEQIATQIDILNQPLKPPKPPDVADLDGDIHGNQ